MPTFSVSRPLVDELDFGALQGLARCKIIRCNAGMAVTIESSALRPREWI
jgi:hypothetical protein